LPLPLQPEPVLRRSKTRLANEKTRRMRTWILSLSLCTTSWFVLPWMSTAAGSDARETPLVRAVRRALPAIVNIHSERTARDRDSAFDGNPGRKVNGMGTGVVVDECSGF
jgi:S1-C subfamily serine protease